MLLLSLLSTDNRWDMILNLLNKLPRATCRKLRSVAAGVKYTFYQS